MSMEDDKGLSEYVLAYQGDEAPGSSASGARHKKLKSEVKIEAAETDIGLRKKQHQRQRQHTKDSRAKLNTKFDELLRLLQPIYNFERKQAPHRSEVLEYAIRAFDDLREQKTSLETEIALSSEKAIRSHITYAVSTGANVIKVLESYLSLVCVKKRWTYGEIWIDSAHTGVLTLEATAFHRALSAEQCKLVHGFRTSSLGVRMRAPQDTIGRTYQTGRPEWLSDLSDGEVFLRSKAAAAANFRSVFAVPINSPAMSLSGVAVFFANMHQEYDATTETFAKELATSVLNTYVDLTTSESALYINEGGQEEPPARDRI